MRTTTKLAGLAALALAALALVAPAYAQTFRLAHHHAVGGAADLAAQHFAGLVSEKSGGRITIRVFPSAQLGQEREAFDLVNQGAIDISITSTGILDKVYPPMSVTALPFVFKSWDHAMTAFNGEFGTRLTTGVREASDTEILGYFGLGFRDLLFTGPARTTLAEMNGMKIRSPESYVFIKMFELMGAKPTPVTWGEVYTAMQTGVAEGLDSPPATALDMKFEEVTKSILKTGHMFGAMLFAMNEAKFNALPAEDQAILKAAGAETGLWLDASVSIPAEQAAYGKLEAAGLTVAEPADPAEWRTAMLPLLEEIRGRGDGSAELIDLLATE
jgi:TRAP-type transport system periplasmic protein